MIVAAVVSFMISIGVISAADDYVFTFDNDTYVIVSDTPTYREHAQNICVTKYDSELMKLETNKQLEMVQQQLESFTAQIYSADGMNDTWPTISGSYELWLLGRSKKTPGNIIGFSTGKDVYSGEYCAILLCLDSNFDCVAQSQLCNDSKRIFICATSLDSSSTVTSITMGDTEGTETLREFDDTSPITESQTTTAAIQSLSSLSTSSIFSTTAESSTIASTLRTKAEETASASTSVPFQTSTTESSESDDVTALAWNVWTEWSACTKTCESGKQLRLRLCRFMSDEICQRRLYTDRGIEIGYAVVWQECNMQNCPIDGVYADWQNWSDCSATCGQGTKRRTRKCVGPFYKGEPCVGVSAENQMCDMDPCPVRRKVAPPVAAFTRADHRPSAIGVGIIGIVCVVIVVVIIASLDVASIAMKRNYSRTEVRHGRVETAKRPSNPSAPYQLKAH